MYKITGIGTSLFLIAAGAIMAWAVNVDVATNGGTRGVDWHKVGVILFIIGIAGLLLTLLATFATQRRDRTTVVERDRSEPTRERIVDR
jgi:uncharacterized membrane protein YidH (DUF202 family)